MKKISIEKFPSPAKEMAEQALSRERNKTAQSRVEELEFSARSQLLSLTDEFLSRHGNNGTSQSDMKDVISFLCATAEMCHLIVTLSHMAAGSTTPTDQDPSNDGHCSKDLIAAAEGMSAIASLPFSLLEDAVDTLPLSKCKVLWIECLEKQSDLLCDDPNLFTTGKFTILRIGNKILSKKLSRERDAEFSGRVLMFLANKFQLSERSGLNIQGKFNLENVTSYEDEEMFKEVMKQQHSAVMSADDVKGVTFIEDEENDSAGGVVDYNLYQTFWGIQEFLCNPNSVVQNVDTKFDEFITATKIVLSAFESHPFPVESAKQARQR